MAMNPILKVSGRAVPVPGDDIDTDRIIPARFMKCVTFDGLGEYLFHDVRFTEDGQKKQHPLNAPEYEGTSILISGSNFGCGSSREHAPQAIFRAGYRAVIAENFAEIFFGNSTNLGIPCVSVSRDDRKAMEALAQFNPAAEWTIDLESKTIRAEDKSWSFDIRESAREVLLNGHYDPLIDLLEASEKIKSKAIELGYLTSSQA